MLKATFGIVLLVAAGLGGAWLHDPEQVRGWLDQARLRLDTALPARMPDAPAWRWAALERGDVVSAVMATGTLRPVATVSVNAQTDGRITRVHADFNDPVRRDQPLAQIDAALLEIAVEKSQADLESARAALDMHLATMDRIAAALENARSDLRGSRASAELAGLHLRDAERELARRRAMGASISAVEMERTESALEVAALNLRVAQAQADSRQAAVLQAEADVMAARAQLASLQAGLRHRQAALREVQIELERSVIRAPVDGVVIWREAEVGQSAQGQTGMALFTIAQDLREMQVNAAIDEAAIGRIAVGQKVEFTVDAHRGRVFEGRVDQIRQMPQAQQNVVTYTVIVRAANPDLALLPGMTANARFILAEARDVVIAPNAALRFTPAGITPPAGTHVWVEGADGLRPVPVQRGLVDEARSEISGPGLAAGMRVVTGLERRPDPGGAGGRTLLGGL